MLIVSCELQKSIFCIILSRVQPEFVRCIINNFFNQNYFNMKNFVLILLCISLFACKESEENKEVTTPKNADKLAFNLKGKVQQVNEMEINIDSMDVSKSDSSQTITTFDSLGYQIDYYTIDSSGKKISEQIIKRNADGTFAEFATLKNGKQSSRLVTETKDGKYIGGKQYDSSDKQVTYYTDLETTEYGQVSAGKQHFMDGRIKTTFLNKFQGPLFVGGSSTDSTGKTTYMSSVVLDSIGNPASEKVTTENKGISKVENNTLKYEYDEKGNWLKQTTFNDKGKATKIVERKIIYRE